MEKYTAQDVVQDVVVQVIKKRGGPDEEVHKVTFKNGLTLSYRSPVRPKDPTESRRLLNMLEEMQAQEALVLVDKILKEEYAVNIVDEMLGVQSEEHKEPEDGDEMEIPF